MFPMNPRDLKRVMKRLGLNVGELSGVRSVTITLNDREIVIRSPQVLVIKTRDQKVYQVIGGVEEVVERKEAVVSEVSFSEDDIKFVMEQAGVSRDEAIRALEQAGGDIAQAILLLTSGSE